MQKQRQTIGVILMKRMINWLGTPSVFFRFLLKIIGFCCFVFTFPNPGHNRNKIIRVSVKHLTSQTVSHRVWTSESEQGQKLDANRVR
jgi:hypothetical protein